MGSPFAATDTYERVIGDSPDAHGYVDGIDPFTVELRPLDSGDRAAIRDELAMSSNGEDLGLALGTVEILHVRRAVVSWTIPGAPASPEAIGRLRPDVLEAIRELVAWGVVPPAPATKAERDAAAAAKPSADELAAQERELEALREDELRVADPEDEEAVRRLPLPSSAGAGAGGS